ncbi:MAG: hypothetical protein ACI8PZ_005860 [Myxococcota bacterium]|jgi:hypothetical protein
MRCLAWVLVALVLSGCTRRAYPAVSFVPRGTPGRSVDLELGAAARLSWKLLVAVNERDPSVLYEIRLDPSVDWQSVASADPIDLFSWEDPSAACPQEGPSAVRCRYRGYRANVPLEPRPVTWLPGADGKVVLPHHIEDLAALPCQAGTCVLGVTEFTTIGRLTKFREDQVARGREETERLFALERGDDGWTEVRLPAIERMRQKLSDWGRASCEDDMVVEGLAVDPIGKDVYVGIRRCDGWSQKVLRFDLEAEREGRTVGFEVVADGIRDRFGQSVAGPTEGLSSLDWAHGTLWATTSWDDWGSSHEPVFGSRLLVLDGDSLTPVPLPETIRDRADALVVLPSSRAKPTANPRELFPEVHALLFFDNDRRSSMRNATLVHALTPRPPDGTPIALRTLGPSALGTDPVGLNGFDFRWFLRDHRLGTLTAVADRTGGETGGWTAALGGLWQVRLGKLARSTRPVLGKAVGHNRQAIALTDYAPVEELGFTGYRAVLSVVPRERTGGERSIASVMQSHAASYEVEVDLPELPAGTGLVLQGVTFDTAPRASGGICLSAVDVGVRWADPTTPGPAVLRAMLLGGLCNDFNAQTAEEHHGLTTEPKAGVRVVLYFATVEGADAKTGSLTTAQRDRPGDRQGMGSVHRVGGDGPLPEVAPYDHRKAPDRVGNYGAKDNLACLRVDGDRAEALVPPTHRHFEPAQSEWRVASTGTLPEGRGTGRGGSLSGFAFGLDLRSFDPDAPDATWDDVSELTARSQNVYLYRYLLRAWAEQGLFVEGGMSHGVHRAGPGKDNALPTAMLLRTDFTWWDGLSAEPIDRDLTEPVGRFDPNLQPEDGFLRWAPTRARDEELSCLER